MIGFNYERLLGVTKSEKPYRRSTNRFPLRDRKQSHKYFLVDTLNGEEVFRVVYGERRKRHEAITGEEQASALAAGRQLYNIKSSNPNSGKYWYEVVPNEIGIVRADNTFEFTTDYSRQGDVMFLGGFSRGYFMSDSKRGGVTYRHSYGDHNIIPVFKGLRIKTDMYGVHESSKYEVVGHRVNRKKAKEFMSQYEDMFKVSSTMFSCMDKEGMSQTAQDVVSIVRDEMVRKGDCAGMSMRQYLYDTISNKEYFSKVMKDSPVDALLIIVLAHGVTDYINSYTIDAGRFYIRDVGALIESIKRALRKDYYPKTEGVLEEVKYGSEFPQSSWNTDVRVNGVNMKRY